MRDLASAYRGENLPKESKGWNFASYLERQKQEEGEERKNAEKYWKNRLEHLPKGPDLPLAKRPQEVEKRCSTAGLCESKRKNGIICKCGQKNTRQLRQWFFLLHMRWFWNDGAGIIVSLLTFRFLTGKQSSRG